MPQEKDINQMNAAELRAALQEFGRGTQQAGPQQPDAPGCANLTPGARDAGATLYGESIMKTDAGKLDAGQRDFLRQSIAATLKDMGY
jgi:hypothetical protein